VDSTTWTIINTAVGIVGVIVAIIGIIVGVNGKKSLDEAIKIKNIFENVSNSTFQQAQTITVNNGADTYVIHQVAKEEAADVLSKFANEVAEELPKMFKQKLDEQASIQSDSEDFLS
jgi:hypothetical protein